MVNTADKTEGELGKWVEDPNKRVACRGQSRRKKFRHVGGGVGPIASTVVQTKCPPGASVETATDYDCIHEMITLDAITYGVCAQAQRVVFRRRRVGSQCVFLPGAK